MTVSKSIYELPFSRKLRAGVVGATGYVGQRFVSLIAEHPWFELTALIASPRSAGQTYAHAMQERWKIDAPLPPSAADMVIRSTDDLDAALEGCDFVFCAVDMEKQALLALEEAIARREVPVISNNSANRWTPDVPMLIPEINPEHSQVISAQRERLGTSHGFIAVKPNCSIQSYVPALHALRDWQPEAVMVTTFQAISGAGKTFAEWPEMINNVIPYIGGEEEKSEREPLRIWGSLGEGVIVPATEPRISAQCYRVAVQEGHTASVAVRFKHKPSADEILQAWENWTSPIADLNLPSAPKRLMRYLPENDRPQPRLDALSGHGMTVTLGRLREDSVLDYKFACLSHNTLRGAAGGAVLMAELLARQGYITAR